MLIKINRSRTKADLSSGVDHASALHYAMPRLIGLLQSSCSGVFTPEERRAFQRAMPDNFELTNDRATRIAQVIKGYKSASDEVYLRDIADAMRSVLHQEYLRSLISDFQRTLADLDPWEKRSIHRTRFLNAVFVAILMTP